jgi:hypothetical protein
MPKAMGAEAAFAGKLDHRRTLSNWLRCVHHIRQPALRHLCSSFGPFILSE